MTAVWLTLALLAGDAPAGTGWTTWLPGILTAAIVLLGTVATVAGTIVVRRMGKNVDQASILKTHVEADKLRGETDKLRIESHGQEVEIARGLLGEIRTELQRVRADQATDRDAMEKRLAEQERLAELRHRQAAEEANARHRRLAEQLAVVKSSQELLKRRVDEHLPWDLAAQERLREVDPEFPGFPPIGDR